MALCSSGLLPIHNCNVGADLGGRGGEEWLASPPPSLSLSVEGVASNPRFPVQIQISYVMFANLEAQFVRLSLPKPAPQSVKPNTTMDNLLGQTFCRTH